MARTALITGASSGIGEAFAQALAKQQHDLVLVARREDRLNALAAKLRAAHGVRVEVVSVDLEKPEAVAVIAAQVATWGLTIDLLVNNAGMGTHGAYSEMTAADDQRMVALNVTALTALTREFAGGMVVRRQGAIINVASTAAFQPIPYFAVYAATKAFVLSFSEGIAEELRPHGVTVQCLCPGPTQTEFLDVAAFKSDVITKSPMMTAEQVVAESLDALRAGRPVHITGLLNQLAALSPRFLPRRLLNRVTGAMFKPTR